MTLSLCGQRTGSFCGLRGNGLSPLLAIYRSARAGLGVL